MKIKFTHDLVIKKDNVFISLVPVIAFSYEKYIESKTFNLGLLLFFYSIAITIEIKNKS